MKPTPSGTLKQGGTRILILLSLIGNKPDHERKSEGLVIKKRARQGEGFKIRSDREQKVYVKSRDHAFEIRPGGVGEAVCP